MYTIVIYLQKMIWTRFNSFKKFHQNGLDYPFKNCHLITEYMTFIRCIVMWTL